MILHAKQSPLRARSSEVTMEERQWPGPKGLIPEPKINAANANILARGYLDSLTVEMRMIDAIEADLTKTLFNETFSSPIMTPAFSHLNKVGKGGHKPMNDYALAAKELNLLNWVGMEPDEEIAEILELYPKTIRIIKPFMDKQMILDQIDFAKEHGALGVGIDIDHVFGKDGNYDIVDGIPLGPVTMEDLRTYVSRAKPLPFIAKGVLSTLDATKCVEAGCSGIFVSHHHGRIPFGIPPIAILPDIRQAIQDKALIFVDCSIETGYDAFKALALGADAVAVGRGILPPLLKDGTPGVITKIQAMNKELKELMGYTCTKDTSSFDPSTIHKSY